MKTEFCTEMREKFIRDIIKIYGDNLISIILYGSVARDNASEESDIDIAILIKNDDEVMHDKMLDLVVDLNLEYNQLLAPALIRIDEFEKWRGVLPYYKNIEKEGIVLWKAA